MTNKVTHPTTPIPPKIELKVMVQPLESAMILRETVGEGIIESTPFSISMSMAGTFIVEFGNQYYLLDTESFVVACLEDYTKNLVLSGRIG